MNSPQIKKLYKMAFENDGKSADRADGNGSESGRKKKTMQDMLKERDI